ncbi:ATP-binding cassette domain-containing protein [Nitrospirales bacterium NOB]|nr:ATP-binding cassette domain-containing protein [Nitrospirales bacterium NOB]
MTILELNQATVYRGDALVFDGLSLVLEEQQQTVILGPNGAGKSTILKLIAGELHPVPKETPSLRVFGEDRWNVWDLRKRLGVVSHELQHRYMDHVRGLDVVLSGFYASIGTYRYQEFSESHLLRAGRLLDELGAGNLKARSFGEMSTGEQRRVLLARALVHDPGVLVFDEPTSGLDLQACFHYLALLRRLIAQGKTIILVTHHMHEIPPEVSRVILLKAGRIMADGDKAHVLTQQRLSALFDVPLQLVQASGWYQALPA